MLALTATLRAAEPAVPARPNLVLILTDDFRWDAFGAAGNRIVRTPNLDRLAGEGTLFTNAFVTTSICYSARASVVLGQYERRHGIRGFGQNYQPDQWARGFPALLRAAGYHTGFVGQVVVGNNALLADKYDVWRPNAGGGFFDANDPSHTHSTARMGSQVVDFIRDAPRDRPFLAIMSTDAPHALDGQPREYPPDDRDAALYADTVIPLPPLATEAAYRKLPEFLLNGEGRRRWSRRFATPEMAQSVMRDYYRLLTGIDREIGRIRAALADKGVADNTVILFISDNGYQLGDRGMADKWLPYEQSIRLPFVVYDPRLPAERRGQKTNAQALNIDVAPTFLELAGLPAPAGMQGRSLVPVLRAGKAPADWPTEFFYEYIGNNQGIPSSEAVRTGRWKYIRWVGRDPEPEELYDLQADPDELDNLIATPAFAATATQLRARWSALRETVK
jgi:arylsulfatase A-like enzyme